MFCDLKVSRSAFIAALAAMMLVPGAQAQDAPNPLSRDKVLRDAEIPVLGNPDGDITIVEFSD